MQRFVWLAAILFFGSGVLGFFAALSNPAIVDDMLESLMPVAETLVSLPSWQLFLIIFLNNTIKSFLAMLLGVFFGVIPALMLFANGFLLGTVFYHTSQEAGIGTLLFLRGILPHGILEIPAFLIAAALGFQLALVFKKRLTSSEYDLKAALKRSSLFFAKYLLPVLFVAALIEAYVTPLLL